MPDIAHQISIAATPDVVFYLVATAPGLSQWWAEDVSMTGDGAVELGVGNRATVYRLRPQTQLAPLRAVWVCESGEEWADTRLNFELTPAGRGTTLRFSHANWRELTDHFVACNTTWGALLFRLKETAEGHASGPLFRRGGPAH